MTQVEKQKFVCFDCETTGLDIEHDRIIEIAAMKFDGTTSFGEYQTLINPEREIPQESMEIHHISNEMVVGKPFIRDVLADFLAFIGKGIIVGHGIGFDIDMIAKAAAREGIPTTIRDNVYIDTVRMARLYGESPSNSLVQLRKHFNIDEEIAHRAMSDVIVNVALFRKLSKTYGTVEKLLDVLSRPIYLKEMPLGKHKGRPLKELPLDYLRWAANKDFDMDLLFSLRTELKKRKKGESFSNNPFQNL
jgi:DNA polymerase-3 subunit epsilon